MSDVSCDDCGERAEFFVTAAYPHKKATHPLWAVYPAPMIRACSVCLPDMIERDAEKPGATQGYLVEVIR